MIRDAGRIPVQRSTKYEPLHVYSSDAADDPESPLDKIEDPEAVFGSYKQLYPLEGAFEDHSGSYPKPVATRPT